MATMLLRALVPFVAAAALLFSHHHKLDWSDSIKPLAWTTPVYDEDMDVAGEAVDNHCTAWAYQKPNNPYETHWITAGHCVVEDEDDPDTFTIADHDYQIDGHPCYVESILWPTDIASLHCEELEAPGLKLASYEPQVAAPLVIRGYPHGYHALFTTKGYMVVKHWHDEGDPDGVVYNVYSAPSAPGNSGSPVFDDNDHVIGLLQIGWGEGFSPISGGLDIDTVRIFMNTLPD